MVLYGIGVDTAKETVTDRLRIEQPGPGYCHFPLGRGPEYFDQLTAEQVVTKFHKGFAKREWVKRKPRNEAFDCRVYVYSALVGLQTMSRLSIESELEHLHKSLGMKPVAAPEPSAEPVPEEPKPKPNPRRSGGWLGSNRDWLRR
jgi:phage terminase large subunit GpA-like protein